MKDVSLLTFLAHDTEFFVYSHMILLDINCFDAKLYILPGAVLFQYLNASGLNSSRHNQDDDEVEPRGTSSSLPPSPFIDNVSTPQPFWTTQAWPSPVWHCFIKGCSVKFEHRDDEFRRVEDLTNNHSLLNKRSEEATYSLNGLIVTEMKETKDFISSSKGVKVSFILSSFHYLSPVFIYAFSHSMFLRCIYFVYSIYSCRLE